MGRTTPAITVQGLELTDERKTVHPERFTALFWEVTKVPADCRFAMTRLDQNRATSILAKKAGAPVTAVTQMTIWGNHSDTQYPD